VTPVWRIARHEVRDAWRSGVLPVLAALVAVLMLAAAVTGSIEQRGDTEQRKRYQTIVESQWDDQPDRHPHRVAHYGFLLFRPRAPLGAFDTGVERYAGTAAFLEAHRQNSANFSDAVQTTGIGRFGDLTLAAVLQLFVPLLIFIITGSSVTREREAGTLALVLGQGVKWSTIVWGKIAGSLAIVGVLVVPGALAVLTWVGLGVSPLDALALAQDRLFDARAFARGSFEWSTDEWTRAFVLAAAHAIFLTVCTAIAVLVSVRSRSSRAALLTLVTTWMILWVVVPRTFAGLSDALFPVPSRSQFEADVARQIRQLGDSHNPNDPGFLALKSQTLARYGVSRIEDLPVNYNGLVMVEGERLTADAYSQHVGQLLTAYRRQSAVVAAVGFVSPYVAMRMLSMALAGSDAEHTLEFERQAEAYRYELIQFLNGLHTHEVALARDRYDGSPEGGAPSRQRIDRSHWRDAPVFGYVRPGLTWALSHQPVSLAALAGWFLALTAGVATVSRRLTAPERREVGPVRSKPRGGALAVAKRRDGGPVF
jgi:ABC-2 type transport system permease protein